MKTKIVFPSLMAWLLFSLSSAHGQTYPTTPYAGEPPVNQDTSPVTTWDSAPVTVPTQPPTTSLVPSDWILYRKCEDCCGPYGGNGPIKTELYLRAGPTFPIGSGIYGDTLTTGWIIQGGARIMCFDLSMTSPWFVDFSISNAWNQGKNRQVRVPFSTVVPDPQGIPTRVNFGEGNLPGLTIRDLNRTFVNFGFGKYWYLFQPADSPNRHWRIGLDGGGRYGTASAQFHQIRQQTDVIGGAYVGGETDMEIPWGCCVFHTGVRLEYSYTWSDILQQTSDVSEISLLFNFGVRY